MTGRVTLEVVWGTSGRLGTGWCILGEVRDGSGDPRGGPDGSGYPRGGPGNVGGPSGRFETSRGSLGEVRNR